MPPRPPQTAIPLRASAPRPYSAPFTPAPPEFAAAVSPHGAAFAIGAVLLFFLFSHASEFIDTSGRFHLVLIIGVLGLVAVITAGSLPAAISTPQGMWLTVFTIWIVMGIPFSSWKGESVRDFTQIWIKSYIAFFLAAGLIFSVEQCRKAIFWLGASTIAIIYYAFRSGFTATDDDRLSVTYGSLGNSNDLAASLLIGAPFLVYVATDKRRNWIARIFAAVALAVLMTVVAKTGSRGALFAIAAMVLIAFVKTSAGNKFKIALVTAALVVAAPFMVSKSLLARYGTIFNSDAGASVEAASAISSTNARRELMKNGVTLTLHHPVFGVGLGNFSHQSANLFMARGELPLWFTCHDIYLLISSETGVLGFIMYMALIVVCFKSLLRMQKNAGKLPELSEVANLSFAIMLSLTAYVVCGIFSTNAYSMQLPLIAGLAAALERVSKPLILQAQASQAPQFAPAYFPRPVAPRIGQTPSAAFRS